MINVLRGRMCVKMAEWLIYYDGGIYRLRCKRLNDALFEFRKDFPHAKITEVWAGVRGGFINLSNDEIVKKLLTIY